MKIFGLSQAGYSDAEIALQVGWELPTVRKWRRLLSTEGVQAAHTQVGRPKCGAMGTAAVAVREAVRRLRQAHPGWGPLTLRTVMSDDEAMAGRKLPSLAGIARFLSEQGLCRSYQKHQPLPEIATVKATEPHRAWEMDARGQEWVPGAGMTSLININDRCSRAKLLSYPVRLGEERMERRLNTADYQAALRLAMTQWGMPDQLHLDRDSVFLDNTCPSPFPSRLHLRLVSLGTDVAFGPRHQPTERGMTERSHQTWHNQVVLGQSFQNPEHLFENLADRGKFLNFRLPCRTLGGVPPLVAHPDAGVPRRIYRPEWEESLMDLSRVHDYLSRGRWYRTASNVGAVSLGAYRYCLGKEWKGQELVITFDPATQELVFRLPKQDRSARMPIKGLSKAELAGPQGPFAQLHGLQLVLPFDIACLNVVRHSDIVPGTT